MRETETHALTRCKVFSQFASHPNSNQMEARNREAVDDIRPAVVLMTAYVIQLCSAMGASYSCSVEAGIKTAGVILE